MIQIKKPIKQDSLVGDEKDITNVKTALFRLGHYQIPEYGLTPYPDRAMFRAITNFQKENDLKVDGTINPNGETLTALNNMVPNQNPSVKSPTMTCTNCGGPHGGSKGDLCPDCDLKS